MNEVSIYKMYLAVFAIQINLVISKYPAVGLVMLRNAPSYMKYAENIWKNLSFPPMKWQNWQIKFIG